MKFFDSHGELVDMAKKTKNASDFLQEYVFGFFSKSPHLIIFVFSLNLYIHWDIQAAVGLRPGKFFFYNCRFE